MIQDVIDLRKMNWVPRRAQDEAKTIAEVHQDAKLEDIKKDKVLVCASIIFLSSDSNLVRY
jgi:hypothetical protein